MNTKFDSNTLITILKWTITILITGFIAQFGKRFANYISEKIKRRKTNSAEIGTIEDIPGGDKNPKVIKKALKQKLKVEKKQQKK